MCLVLWLVLFSAAGTMCAPFQVAAESGPDASAHNHHWHGSSASIWEGSPQGIAYSEFNHHLAGAFLLLIGLSEFRQIWGLPFLLWTRLFLPVGLLGAGVFLLIWSDHEAWPIGSLTFTQTFFGHDPEILQHKAFGVLSLGSGYHGIAPEAWTYRRSQVGRAAPAFRGTGGAHALRPHAWSTSLRP